MAELPLRLRVEAPRLQEVGGNKLLIFVFARPFL